MHCDYESAVERFYTKHLRPGDRCVDVGAHTGRHTLPMARAVGRTGLVVAFEPLDKARAALVRALDAARCREEMGAVQVHGCALGDVAGRASFVVVDNLPEYSGLRERIYDRPVEKRVIDVEVATLDSFAQEIGAVRYVKIDVEGGELQVLRGAKSILDKYRPIVSIEWGDNSLVNYPYNSSDMARFIVEKNYRVVGITGERLDFDGFIAAAARQVFWDYILIPEEKIDRVELP